MRQSSDPSDELKAPSPRGPHVVVGIGASAGGLDAIERFFDHVPSQSGLTFVVVQHLSPDFRSLMDELLARHTDIPIFRVENGMQIEPDAIYLIPPKKNMVLSGGRLLLADQDQKGALNLPIDLFFRSLAQDVGDRAVAVVLSGTGSDGSHGLPEVHQAGGLILVQDDESASFDGMPRAAIATGVCDYVLPPELMPKKILKHVGVAVGDDEESANQQPEAEDSLTVIFGLLRREFGIDFSLYKLATVSRRLDRRLLLMKYDHLEDYVKRLEEDPAELQALYQDLLVEVTQFFRDPDAFDILRSEVVPVICERSSDEEVRVWVPGCATGEEAYSLAILFREHMDRLKQPRDVRIFATDVHRPSLEIAANGRYRESAIKGLPAAHLRRYFSRRDDDFVVSKQIRQMVIFAPHNLTKDPPFTKLDLISCRNLLIYLNPQVQRKVLTLFHFGLSTGGVLLLGPSESLTELSDEFQVIDSRWKVFRKRRDVRLPGSLRLPTPFAVSETSGFLKQRPRNSAGEDGVMSEAYDSLLTRFVPPSFLINEYRELVHVFGNASRYIRVPEGKATRDVLKMVDENLRLAMSTALHRAAKEHQPVVYRAVQVVVDGKSTQLRVTVEALPESRSRSNHFLVCLEEEHEVATFQADVRDFDVQGQSAEQLRLLGQELRHAKEHLQSTIEELETSNEELQSTNEELVASNEELQSTNEELHSVNEELYTVNAEHQRKIEELTQLTHDMDNLLLSTDIGTVFLDQGLNIRKFTPAAARVFNLLPQDVGRPLQHISPNLKVDHGVLLSLVEEMRSGGDPVEHAIEGNGTEACLMRVLPYRTERGKIDGVVLTFTDISAVRQTQARLENQQRRMQIAMDAAEIGVWEWDLRSNEVHWGSRLQKILGIGPDRFVTEEPGAFATDSDTFWNFVHPEDRVRVADALQSCLRDQESLDIDFRVVRGDGEEYYVTTRADVTRVLGGRPVRITGACLNVTTRKLIDNALRESRQQLATILENTQAIISVKDLTGKYLLANRRFAELFGKTAEEMLGLNDFDVFPREVAELHRSSDQLVVRSGKILEVEETLPHADGPHTYISSKCPLQDEAGAIFAVAAIGTDITDRKLSERQVQEAVQRRDHFLAMLSHELRNPLGAIVSASQVLRRSGASEEQRLEAREVIARQAEQMSRLLDDLLDVARINENKMHLRRQPVDLRAALEEVQRVVAPQVREAGLTWEIHVCDEPAWVQGDPARIQQVQVNLLHNAIKYTPPKGKIEYHLEVEGSEVLIRVRDTGVGMTPEAQNEVFELFVQSEQSLDRAAGGLGVGLTLVKTLILMHGGEVAAHSEGRNKGSEFVVRLPRLELPVAAQTATGGKDNEVPPKRADGQLHVVVVEDNPDSRRMLETILRLDGYHVTTAEDGRLGLRMILEERPEVALVDIGLPELNGYDLARKVRERLDDEQTCLVALTGYGRPEDRQAVKEAGFDYHLVKPIRAPELTRILQSVAHRR
jgi:two-component system, chemotaxis family, CheB/CheR fusion protein